jgi:polysaccharide pyruvyl transferase WcaK-like protein
MITLFCIRPKGFNVGNDAIYLGMQRYIFEAFGQVVNIISLPATSRYESHAKAGLSAQTVYEINLYGDGVIVGGGNLYENGELQVDTNALEALEVPLMLFSLSRGRVYNRRGQLVNRTNAMPKLIAQAINRKAKFSLARDGYTGDYLQEIGATHSRVGGCPTIFLNRIVDRLPRLHPPDRSGVLISVRNPSLMSIPLKQQALVHRHIGEMIEFLRAEGHKDIRLLCHDHRDIPFAASFADVEFVYLDDIYTYLALLNSCALNVTYRLHSALPCLSFCRPMISISYDERALSLMRTIGYEDWNIDMIQTPEVVAQVKDRYRRLGELPAWREKTKSIWDGLDKVMGDTFRAFAAEVTAYHKTNG